MNTGIKLVRKIATLVNISYSFSRGGFFKTNNRHIFFKILKFMLSNLWFADILVFLAKFFMMIPMYEKFINSKSKN